LTTSSETTANEMEYQNKKEKVWFNCSNKLSKILENFTAFFSIQLTGRHILFPSITSHPLLFHRYFAFIGYSTKRKWTYRI